MRTCSSRRHEAPPAPPRKSSCGFRARLRPSSIISATEVKGAFVAEAGGTQNGIPPQSEEPPWVKRVSGGDRAGNFTWGSLSPSPHRHYCRGSATPGAAGASAGHWTWPPSYDVMGAGPAQGSGHTSGLPAPARMAEGPTPPRGMYIPEDQLSKASRRTSPPPPPHPHPAKQQGGPAGLVSPPRLPHCLSPESMAERSLGQGPGRELMGPSHTPRGSELPPLSIAVCAGHPKHTKTKSLLSRPQTTPRVRSLQDHQRPLSTWGAK